MLKESKRGDRLIIGDHEETYQCADNDSEITGWFRDGVLDELHFTDGHDGPRSSSRRKMW